MKHSWVWGVIAFYLLILGIEMMVTGGSAFSSTGQSNLEAMMSPTLTNQSGVVAAVWSTATQVASYFITFIQAIFLWSPSIFTGYLVWLWVYICLPTTITMIIGIIIVLRGGSSG